MLSFLSTCFGTPRVPSSVNPYVNTNSTSALVQYMKHRSIPVSTKKRHHLVKFSKVKNVKKNM
jgi:hypothetical protein